MTSVVTFSQARCVSVRADGRAFSLRAMNRMFSFAAFFTAHTTLCVIRYDHLAMKLGPGVQEWKFIQRLWTLLFGLHVRCGAFIQCGGKSATNLRVVRYRARANWIGPEPDSVLRSVRSLKIGDRPFLLNWPNSSEKFNLLAWKLLHLQKFKK